MNPKNCPFIHYGEMRRLLDSATFEQLAAVRELKITFDAEGKSIGNPRDRAYFATNWLRSVGERPIDWDERARPDLWKRA